MPSVTDLLHDYDMMMVMMMMMMIRYWPLIAWIRSGDILMQEPMV